jgi:hypothetical protein
VLHNQSRAFIQQRWLDFLTNALSTKNQDPKEQMILIYRTAIDHLS